MRTTFSVAAILTFTTGKFVCSLDEMYELARYMTGESIATPQLPRIMDECRAELFRQHPTLAQFNAGDVHDEATAREFVKRTQSVVGTTTLPLLPLPMGAHLHIDMLEEARAMYGDDGVIPVVH